MIRVSGLMFSILNPVKSRHRNPAYASSSDGSSDTRTLNGQMRSPDVIRRPLVPTPTLPKILRGATYLPKSTPLIDIGGVKISVLVARSLLPSGGPAPRRMDLTNTSACAGQRHPAFRSRKAMSGLVLATPRQTVGYQSSSGATHN